MNENQSMNEKGRVRSFAAALYIVLPQPSFSEWRLIRLSKRHRHALSLQEYKKEMQRERMNEGFF